MTFLFRLLFAAFLIVAIIVVFLLTAYVIVLAINRGLQWGAENIGGELGDMFKWLRSRMPKIKIERKVDDKNP